MCKSIDYLICLFGCILFGVLVLCFGLALGCVMDRVGVVARGVVGSDDSVAPLTGTRRRVSGRLPEKTIERVFMKMGAIFLNAWSSNFPTKDAVRVGMGVWAAGLAALSVEQIARGLRACEDRPGFPPSLGEFKRLCVGLPSRAGCVARVLAGEGVDLLSVSVMRRIGAFDLKHSAARDLERRVGVLYEGLYDEVFAVVVGLEGEWVPAVVDEEGLDAGVALPVVNWEVSEALARESLRAIRDGRGNVSTGV